VLTIFATPKPFRGLIQTIQTNAIASWKHLPLQPEIILLGNDEGTADVAASLGVTHIPSVQCNDFGTPLLNSMFEMAQDKGKGPWFAQDFVKVIQQIPFDRFLITGTRTDVDITDSIDFTQPTWEADLLQHVAAIGTQNELQALDYFVFPRGLYPSIPEFAVGRPGFDNWLLGEAVRLGVPVIDAQSSITAIHQNHHYNHPDGKVGLWKGPEAVANRQLMGQQYDCLLLDRADWQMTPQGLQKPFWTTDRLLRYLNTLSQIQSETEQWTSILQTFIQSCVESTPDPETLQAFQQQLGEFLFGQSGQWFALNVKTTAGLQSLSFAEDQRSKHLEAELEQLRAKISGMESSKFWQLRQAWFKLKAALGLKIE
jgi:hypothetical protein